MHHFTNYCNFCQVSPVRLAGEAPHYYCACIDDIESQLNDVCMSDLHVFL